jgi:hypothetical protein
MGQRVDARDVLDPNARTRRAVPASLVGHFRPTGPNAWDEYEFVSDPEQPLEVRAGLEVQLEPRGVHFRVRKDGRVLRCRFEPTAEERQRAGSEAPSALRRLFQTEYLASFNEAPGQISATLARKLRDTDGEAG